jgi:hypothetical protein
MPRQKKKKNPQAIEAYFNLKKNDSQHKYDRVKKI